MSTTEFDRRWEERDKAIEEARGPFEAIRKYLHITIPNWTSRERPATVYRRLVAATSAVRQWRYVNQQKEQTNELEILAIRICADQFARDIEDAAHQAGQDPATIAWVTAGLRCPSKPFCTGCRACFTITSPLRPND